MRVTKPDELKISSTVEKIVEKLEFAFQQENLTKEHGMVRIIIEGEYSAEDRQKAALEYRMAGWDFVSHNTSSEVGQVRQGEIGRTLFVFMKM